MRMRTRKRRPNGAARSFATRLWQEDRYDRGLCIQCGDQNDREYKGRRTLRCADCLQKMRHYKQTSGNW